MQILQPLKELYKHFQNTPTILSTYTMLYLDYEFGQFIAFNYVAHFQVFNQ